MALFGKKKAETKASADAAVVRGKADLSWVLIRPRITEKATDMSTVRAYVFNVNPNANKCEIAQAVTQIYKVIPLRVRITPIRSKAIRNARTGKPGVKPGGKKAYVYLKEGDTINLV